MRWCWPWLLVCACAASAALQPTTTTLQLAGGTPVYGGVNFRASVNANLGSITFTLDGHAAPPVVVDGSGNALITLSMTAGTHLVGASYENSGLYPVYAPSAAAPVTVEVAKGPTRIDTSGLAAQIGQPWTMSVYVHGEALGPAEAAVTASPPSGSPVSCPAVPGKVGFYTCTVTFPAVGTFSVPVSYSGDSNTLPSTATASVTVGKAAPGVYIAAAPDSPVYGQQETVNVLVLGAQNVPAPTGTVTFSESGHFISTAAIGSDGRALFAGTFTVGSHTVTGVYNGDANYQAGAPVGVTMVVGKAPTSTAISADTARAGQSFNVYASVSLTAGAGTIGGTVDFSYGGQGIIPCAGLFPSMAPDGVAHCTTSFPKAGSYTVTVRYNGDANTLPSSGSLNVTVGKVPAAVYLASSPTSPVYGIPVTLGALVLGAPGIPAPTGSVSFSDGGASLGTQPLGSDGHATLTGPLNAGAHAVTAAYNGDDQYQASAPAALNVAVARAPVVVAVSSDPAQIGQPVVLRASVALASGSGTFGGTVDFAVSGAAVAGCTGVPLSNGSGACTAKLSQIGTVTLTAAFSGDGNTLPGSGSVAVAVTKAVPGVYLSSTPAAPVYGVPVSLGTLVLGAPGVAAPTGTVTLSDGGTPIGTQNVGSDGRASLSAFLSVGAHAIASVYSGDANYQASLPVAATIVIGKSPTVLAVSADPAQVGQPVTLRASVALASSSAPISGTVDFAIGGIPVAGCMGVPVLKNAAACKTTAPQLGTYVLSGSFSGDGNTLPSTASVAVSVNKAAPGIYLTAAPAAPVYGVPVTLGVLVLGAPGLTAPTGTVTLSDGVRTLTAQSVDADGRVSFRAALGAGTHTIAAVYSGDANYQSASASPASMTVARAETTTALTALTGGPFTATVRVVAPGSGSPTGSVKFLSGTTVVGAAPLAAQGSAFSAVLPVATASGIITAVYAGDANFAGSNSDPMPVSPLQTQVTVTPDANPSPVGQTVAFTISVAILPHASAGPPAGSVTLEVDGAAAGTANLSGGQVVFRATPAVGAHVITARYSGEAAYPAATGTLTQVVTALSASLSLTSSPPDAVYGQAVTLTARLGPQTGAKPPAGSIQFADGDTALGSAATVGDNATLTVSLAAGSHPITASWAGDGTWGAASAQAIQIVEKASTTTGLTLSGGALTAGVKVIPPGAGSPNGTVRFLDAGSAAVLGSVPLNNGSAAFPLPSSSDAVVAAYSGGANFQGSISATLTLLSITNAASYRSGGVAPDELLTLFGPDLAGATASASGAPESSLAGTTVSIRDGAGANRIAPLLYVSPAQAAALLPPGLAPGPATLTVSSPLRTLSLGLTVAATAPGLFTADSSGKGAPAGQTITVHTDGTQDAPRPAAEPIDWSDPSATIYLVLYGTGIRHAGASPGCTIAGQSAPVLFSGAQPAFPGVDQVNVMLPPALRGAGQVSLMLVVDGQETNPVLLSIH